MRRNARKKKNHNTISITTNKTLLNIYLWAISHTAQVIETHGDLQDMPRSTVQYSACGTSGKSKRAYYYFSFHALLNVCSCLCLSRKLTE